jgi:DNA polymerase III alpha subunit
MRAKLIGTAVATGLSALALAACGGDDDESSVDAFCDKVDEVRAAADPFEGLAPNDTEGAVDALGSARDQLHEVVDVAPDEIRDDAEQMESAFNDLVTAAEGAEKPEDLAAVFQEFEQAGEELEGATQRLEEYTNENCGEEEEEDA